MLLCQLPRARLTKLTDHRAVRKGQDLQLNYHICLLQGLLRSESRQEEALSTVWTWADKSSVICVLLLELARNALILHRRGSPRRDFLGNGLLRSSSAQGGESSKREPAMAREEVPKHGTSCAQQTPWWWLGLSLRRQAAPSTKCWKEDRVSSGWDCSFWAFTLSLRERHLHLSQRWESNGRSPFQHQKQGKTDYYSFPLDISPCHMSGCLFRLYEATWAHGPFSLHQGTNATGSG